MCGEQWSRAASIKFNSLVSGCTLVVKVFSIVHGILHVDVYRYFETLEEVSIRDILISDGFAEPAEESYESKVSISCQRKKGAIRQMYCYFYCFLALGLRSIYNQCRLCVISALKILSTHIW